MQVDFYQLSRDPVEKVLPQIAERILAGGDRLLVVAADRGSRDAMSEGLWTHKASSFLAHGHAGEANAAIQPILLSQAMVAENGARHVALADGLWREEALAFARAFYFFDDATIDGARASWRDVARRDGVEPRFWRQDGGRWTQVA